MIDPGISLVLLAGIFFLIAVLYASVGFGGGSSYLALLTLYVSDFLVIKTTGLLCNLVVVTGGSWLAFRKGFLDRRLAFPFLIGGVPSAFVGGLQHLEQRPFFLFLGSVLVLSGLLLMLQIYLRPLVKRRLPFTLWSDVLLGSAIGGLSGLVGIGGGILLSPALHLLNRDEPRKIAATASVFILLNSVAGLSGQIVSGHFKVAMPETVILLLTVFLGGQLGSRAGLQIIRPSLIRGLTGILVCYIGARLVISHLNGIDL